MIVTPGRLYLMEKPSSAAMRFCRGDAMAESICSKDEVYSFIDEVQAKLILNEIDNLTIVLRKDKKTQNCMAELKLRHRDVATILKNLEISNYAHTRSSFPCHGYFPHGSRGRTHL